MRDPNRIPDVLAAIERLWKLQPDLRLGQLIANITRTSTGDASIERVWAIEDDELAACAAEIAETGQWEKPRN